MTSIVGDARGQRPSTSADGPGPETLACLFRSFAEPARLAILRRLAAGDQRVVDLTRHLGLAQSTVSQHLSCLRECGLVSSRQVGRASLHSLAHPAETSGLLAAAGQVLAVTDDAVVSCDTYGLASRG